MTTPSRQWMIAIAIGLAAGALALAVGRFNPAAASRVQTAVADFVFLDEQGFRLGRIKPLHEIALVLFDARSASQLGGLPTFEQDLSLYRALLAADVRLIGDTRMIAELGDAQTSGSAQLLAEIAKLDARGKLYRDVWLPVDWPAELVASYTPYIAHNVLNMHANSDSFSAARLYPLVISLVDGLHESMPLILARAARGNPLLSSAETVDEVRRSGVAAAWEQAFPGRTSLGPEAHIEQVEASPYRLGDQSIPWQWFPSKSSLVPPGGFWISYAAPATEYPRVSYIDAAENVEQLRGKIVIVGFAADIDPTTDVYASPSSTRPVAAAEAVAAALETLLRQAYVEAPPAWASPTLVFLVAVGAAVAGAVLKPLPGAAAMVALLTVVVGGAIAQHSRGYRPDLVLAPAACLLGGGASFGRRYWSEVRLRSRVTDLFGRYVPRAVVNQLMLKPDAEALAMGGVKREVTVLFADVRGFTPFAERLAPEQVIDQLNSLLKIMVDATFAHGGTLDKFIGDSILVLFNAPLDQPDHALEAARTAWDIQQGVARHSSGLTVGVGIHRGLAVVGTVGTPQRMEYTAIGSTVNIASRLCAAAASGQILVTAAAAVGLEECFRLEPQPPLRVKGMEAELETYVVAGPTTASST